MAGHSKWSNTKHRKNIQDTKRSKIFCKLIKELTAAVKLGGSNPLYNSHLKAAITKSLSYNMPKLTIKKVITRCSNKKNKK
ncbi:Probable transcriptional regulatory protein YebC [Buchnera aphidicola (Thelaxes suberi)]|uniref:hypothetical protein n=1 Tax=Buchnera aphidicola TaxID=9 RepID=UPI003464DE54